MSTALIDTHCHLGLDDFDADREAVIDRARERGVGFALVVGQTDSENRRALELADQHPFILPAAGLHPEFAGVEDATRCLTFVREHGDRLAGIGEIGLDYFLAREEPERVVQNRVFESFLQLGMELDLGLTVHSRSAGHYAVDALIANGCRRAVLHAFDGKHRYAQKGVEAGLKFSIPPSIIRSQQKRNLVAALPLDALLLESDAPVLGPDREVRNEPANIVLALEAIAEVKGVDREEVEVVTTKNARATFRIPK